MGKVLFSLNILSALVLVVVLVFNGLQSVPNNGVFNNTIGNVSDKYDTEITPAGLTFSIWGVIYLFQIAWMIYALTTLCRRNGDGPIYENPVILDPVFHICYIIANLGNIGFLFTFDKEQLLGAAICIFITTGFGFASLAKSFNAIQAEKERMDKKDLIASYILIENGLDVYFTWTSVASCVSIAMILQHSPILGLYLDPTVAGVIGISILLAANLVFYILDLTKFFETCKYMYMGYITLLWALSGVLIKNYDISNPITVITIVTLVITALTLLAKIGLTIYRAIFVPQSIKSEKLQLA